MLVNLKQSSTNNTIITKLNYALIKYSLVKHIIIIWSFDRALKMSDYKDKCVLFISKNIGKECTFLYTDITIYISQYSDKLINLQINRTYFI